MLKVIKDMLRFDSRFRTAFILLSLILLMTLLSFVSPFAPDKTFQVAMDAPPSLEHLFGTTSRGQDLFWWMTFGVRNSLLLGVIAAVISRVIAMAVGLTAGYRGGWVDRVLMAVNDSFVVMPLLPILILLSFLIRGSLTVYTLAIHPRHVRLAVGCPPDPVAGAEPQGALVLANGRLLRHPVVADLPQRAPALRAAGRLRHDHQQHAVVDRHGGDALGARPVGPEPPHTGHVAVLGEPARRARGRHLVVDRCPGARRRRALHRALLCC